MNKKAIINQGQLLALWGFCVLLSIVNSSGSGTHISFYLITGWHAERYALCKNIEFVRDLLRFCIRGNMWFF